MIRRLAKVVVSIILVSALVFSASTAIGQTPAEQVWVTNVDNEILPVNCGNPGTVGAPILDLGSNLKGLFVRDDLFLIGCEHNQKGAVKIFDRNRPTETALITQDIPFPYVAAGDAVEGKRNLYVITRSGGGDDQLWRIPPGTCTAPNPLDCANGGYGGALLIDPLVEGLDGANVVPARLLSDVKVVPASANDPTPVQLYVLSEDPAMLFLYDNPDACPGLQGPNPPSSSCDDPKTPIVSTSQFGGLHPTGVAVADDGKILVSTAEGTILRFNSGGGSPLTPPFAENLGNLVGIAAGVQAGQSKVFVTVHPGSVLCFGVAPPSDPNPGTGVPAGSVTGINPPAGVSLGSASGTFLTNDGQVISFSALQTTFGQVNQGGAAFASCQTFIDPRPDSAVNAELFLCVDNDPNTLDPNCADEEANPTEYGVPAGFPNTIPSYVRGFHLGDNSLNPRLVRVCQMGTSALLNGLTNDKSDEGGWLFFDPQCFDDAPTNLVPSETPPQLFFTEEDLSLREGAVAINQTTECNFDGDDRWGDSLVLPSLIDFRPIDDPINKASCSSAVDSGGIVEWQAFNLCGVLGDSCVSRSTGRSLQRTLDRAIRKFNTGDYDAARLLTRQFELDALNADSATCDTEELQARAKAMTYQLCRALAETVDIGGTGPNSPCLTGLSLP